MQNLLFVFGSHPELSLAELQGWGEALGLSPTIEHRDKEVAVVSGLSSQVQSTLLNDLAGTIKVAEVVLSVPAIRSSNEEEMKERLLEALEREVAQHGSITFGTSYYGGRAYVASPSAQARIALELKKALRTRGHVRWVSGRGQPLSSVVVEKNKLTRSQGIELLVYASRDQFMVARTIAVQPFEAWGARDFGRPRRNAKQGMLPPKLARMMVNLLGLKPVGTLLDPFCGSGTVLMEAALAGWMTLKGSDRSVTAVHDTEKNFSWLREHHSFSQSLNTTVIAERIERLTTRLPAGSIRAIVTEPFLGRPLQRRPTHEDIVSFEQELLPLYRTTLATITTLLELGGRAVVALPAWSRAQGQPHVLSITEQSLPSALRFHRTSNSPLIYARENQFVGRALVVLEKVSRT